MYKGMKLMVFWTDGVTTIHTISPGFVANLKKCTTVQSAQLVPARS